MINLFVRRGEARNCSFTATTCFDGAGGVMTKAKKSEYMPLVLLDTAKQYQLAANRLIDASTTDEVFSIYPLPLLFLFYHCVELALKAFLRAHQLPVVGAREHHQIVNLYKECVTHGLKEDFGAVSPSTDSRLLFFQLLHDCNPNHGFRYADSSTAVPNSLLMIRDVINKMIEEISEKIQAGGAYALYGREVAERIKSQRTLLKQKSNS
jgi:hypothetical protein